MTIVRDGRLECAWCKRVYGAQVMMRVWMESGSERQLLCETCWEFWPHPPLERRRLFMPIRKLTVDEIARFEWPKARPDYTRHLEALRGARPGEAWEVDLDADASLETTARHWEAAAKQVGVKIQWAKHRPDATTLALRVVEPLKAPYRNGVVSKQAVHA
jgi:hypothetical protein